LQHNDGYLDSGSEALTCAFNRRGNYLAVGCNDGRIAVWDFMTRGSYSYELRYSPHHLSEVYECVCSSEHLCACDASVNIVHAYIVQIHYKGIELQYIVFTWLDTAPQLVAVFRGARN